MSVIVVGLSHRSAPIDLLERLGSGPRQAAALASRIHAGDHVEETLVLATCNRVEIVAEAGTFHGALAEIAEALGDLGGLTRDELADHLYVHHDERAVAHLFTVACGLDSMAVGESQILGQLRDAVAGAQRAGRLGASLNPLLQHALRVGKRAHSETGLDEVSRSLVGLGLDRAVGVLGDLRTARTVVVGAGAMSGLALATVAAAGVEDVTVVNRTPERAERLAELHHARAATWDELDVLVGSADLVIACTGATGHVLEADRLAQARTGAGRTGAPQVVLDLALPRDIDPGVTRLAGVHLWGLAELQEELQPASDRAASDTLAAVSAVQDIVTGEVAAHLAERRSARLAPTLAALRASAARVVDAEMVRLDQRLPQLPDDERAEVRRTVQRVVDKLLHTPTVRVKELAGADASGPSGPADYAQALRQLFDLDPHEAAVVPAPPLDVPAAPFVGSAAPQVGPEPSAPDRAGGDV